MSPRHERYQSRTADRRTRAAGRRGLAGGPTRRPSTGEATPQGGHTSLELAKWVALVTMIVDHYGKIVAPELYGPTHTIGRISFPLFAAIVGMRLALSPEIAGRYLRRLLPWALISQPAFAVAGRDWSEGNILFASIACAKPLEPTLALAPAVAEGVSLCHSSEYHYMRAKR